MGKMFGDLAFIRGIVYYHISPFEMKAYGPALTTGILNFLPRLYQRWLTWAPPFVICVAVYQGVEHLHAQMIRKDPEIYKNEVDPNDPDCENEKRILAQKVKKK